MQAWVLAHRQPGREPQPDSLRGQSPALWTRCDSLLLAPPRTRPPWLTAHLPSIGVAQRHCPQRTVCTALPDAQGLRAMLGGVPHDLRLTPPNTHRANARRRCGTARRTLRCRVRPSPSLRLVARRPRAAVLLHALPTGLDPVGHPQRVSGKTDRSSPARLARWLWPALRAWWEWC